MRISAAPGPDRQSPTKAITAQRGRGERKRPARGWGLRLTPTERDASRGWSAGLSNRTLQNGFSSRRALCHYLATSTPTAAPVSLVDEGGAAAHPRDILAATLIAGTVIGTSR